MDSAYPASRRHDLDALRAFAMLLGIALHAALSFGTGPWLVQDSVKSAGFGLLTMAIHGFRMPLFFLLSGFFTAMLWRRRGLRALLSQRMRRVFLPLVVGMLTVVPLTHWVAAKAMAAPGAGAGSGETVPSLWRACAAGDVRAVAAFLDQGVTINGQDPAFGSTPLSYAVLFGQGEVVGMLLERGADVGAMNRDGGTALHAAAFTGRSDIAQRLLAAGADPGAENPKGQTPLDLAGMDLRTSMFFMQRMRIPLEEEALKLGRRAVVARLSMAGEVVGGKERPGAGGLWLLLTQVPLFHHLWFLWFLCWMVAGFAVVAWGLRKVESKPRPWVTGRWRYLWLIPLTLVPAWWMGRGMPHFGPETSTSLLPPISLLLYYAVFYGYGALYYDSRGEVDSMGRGWWWTLPVTLLVLFPVGLHATYEGGERWRWMAMIIQVLYVWVVSFGMMGLFRRWVTGERRWVRYLSDASYWMYLAHLPLVLAAQGWVRDWPQPALLKWLAVCGAVFAVLLISYEWGIRYTWVGAMLNGRKVRVRSPGAAAPRAGNEA